MEKIAVKKRLLPYLVFGIRVYNTRAHVVIVILSLLGICKAPKFSMVFLGVSFTQWFGDFLEFCFKPEVYFCGFRLRPNPHLSVT